MPPAMPTDFRILGAAICWEYYMPLLRQVTYSKGVEIYCSSCRYRSSTSSCPQRPLRTDGRPQFWVLLRGECRSKFTTCAHLRRR